MTERCELEEKREGGRASRCEWELRWGQAGGTGRLWLESLEVQSDITGENRQGGPQVSMLTLVDTYVKQYMDILATS